jgi:hypothetical protein
MNYLINLPIVIIAIFIIPTYSLNLQTASSMKARSTTSSPLKTLPHITPLTHTRTFINTKTRSLPQTLLYSTPTPPNTPDENGDIYDDPNAPLYDDQVEYKAPELSNTMKERLRNEAQSFGADYNTKSPPVILYISGFILVLVALGGKGILF